MRELVADASAVLAAYLPDEASAQAQLLMEDYALGRVNLCAPRLLALELLNACLAAARRGRIGEELLVRLAGELSSLHVAWADVEERAPEVLAAAREFGITAYDAAYVAAARLANAPLVTADEKLCRALEGRFPLLVPLRDYGRWRKALGG